MAILLFKYTNVSYNFNSIHCYVNKEYEYERLVITISFDVSSHKQSINDWVFERSVSQTKDLKNRTTNETK